MNSIRLVWDSDSKENIELIVDDIQRRLTFYEENKEDMKKSEKVDIALSLGQQCEKVDHYIETMFSGTDKEDLLLWMMMMPRMVLPRLHLWYCRPCLRNLIKIKLHTWAVQMIQYAGGRAGII